MGSKVNKLIAGLGEIFSRRLLAPKVLLAPSLRVGQQWLDAVARSGQPLLNVRARTLTGLALDLAAPAMVDRGVRYASPAQLEVLVGRAFAGLRSRPDRYLTRLDPSAGVVASLARSLRDLRLAGLDSRRLAASAFDAPDKAAELRDLLAAFERALEDNKLIDYAGALDLAAAAAGSASVPLLLLPADQEDRLNRRERQLWESFPAASRLVVAVDRPDDGGDANDAGLLRFIARPGEAPAPEGDGSAAIFRAIGEVNEVREVFRLCLARGIPFDDVEVLHPQYDTYVPLLHETAALLAEPGAEPPVTFSEGLPARLFRPGRALAGLVEWATSDFAQGVLVRLVQDGLLRLPRHEAGVSFTRIAAILRAVPVAVGRDRWRPALDRALDAARGLAGSAAPEKAAPERLRAEVLAELRDLIADLLDLTAPGSQARRLRNALLFLERHARGASEADETARANLAGAVTDMIDALGDDDVPGFEPMSRLALLPGEVRVGGLGPRPGRVFVSPLRGGGHSGRGHTFILGLDDGRFPGGTNQDPVLLDREREGISSDLPRAGERAGRVLNDFALLLSRLRGRVTLSYSCRDITDDHDCFPSPTLLSAGRILSGGRAATLSDFLAHAGPAAAFAPDAAAKCLGPSEWWLLRLTAGPVTDAEALVGRAFPHLGHGFIARETRASRAFTEYDGFVPEAGADLLAASPPRVFSASRFELLAQNPLDYFFKYVLRVEPPEEYTHDPAVWLDPLARGSLLHAVFHDFLVELAAAKLRPASERDWPRLAAVLDRRLKELARELPPASPAVMERERRELEMAARIFLVEEEEHCRFSEPRFLEAAIGLRQDEAPTAIDTASPVAIDLPDGRRILACGYVDRIDRLDGPGDRHVIWDYKTGGSGKYDKDPPFWQGRCIQNALYCLMVQARLAEVEPGARVTGFGYFFPTDRERGERITWTAEELADGRRVLADLYDLAARGAFPLSDEPKDAAYSDRLLAFGDVEARAAETRRKLEEPANDALDPLRRLRPAKEKKPPKEDAPTARKTRPEKKS